MQKKLIYLFLLLFSWYSGAQAEDLQRGSMGVVLMHGKGGQPSRNIATLAQTLEAEGVKVVTPVMAWSGSRGQPFNYDKTYDMALREIDGAIAKLRARGATKFIVAGQSLGANAALAFAARKPGGISGVIMLAPGHTPERMRSADILSAQAEARQMVAAAKGSQRREFPDLNVGQSFMVTGTYAGWYSYFDPLGAANMPANAARLRAMPILYVVGRSDPLTRMGRAYIYKQAKPHPKSRYVEVNADHFDTPHHARSLVLDWLKSL